jgi:hypothetical protein
MQHSTSVFRCAYCLDVLSPFHTHSEGEMSKKYRCPLVFFTPTVNQEDNPGFFFNAINRSSYLLPRQFSKTWLSTWAWAALYHPCSFFSGYVCLKGYCCA